MHEYRIDERTGRPEHIGEASNDPVSINQIPKYEPTETELRIENIRRQIKRYESLEQTVGHWRETIIRQTAERDRWDAEIKHSEAMLRLRSMELHNRTETVVKLKKRLALLIASQLENTVSGLQEAYPELLTLLSRLKGGA